MESKKFISKDLFLTPEENQSVYASCKANQNHLTENYLFEEKTLEQCLSGTDFKEKCIKFASEHFDLSSMIGYEYWHNFNAPPTFSQQDWHLDKDEVLYHYRHGGISLPLCTIIYYPFAEAEEGGELIFREFSIEVHRPISNEIVCFSSGIWHSVNGCAQERVSVVICPWHYKVEKFIPKRHMRKNLF